MRVLYPNALLGEIRNEPCLPFDDTPAGTCTANTDAVPGAKPPAFEVEKPVPIVVCHETGISMVLLIPGMLEQEIDPVCGGGLPLPAICVTVAVSLPPVPVNVYVYVPPVVDDGIVSL